MSKKTVELLEAFDAMGTPDQQIVAIEILRRTRDLPFDSGPLSDEEIGASGRALMTAIDDDERDSSTR